MVETRKLLFVIAIVEAVGYGNVGMRFVVVVDAMIGCPSIVDNTDVPEVMVRVMPPSEDDRAVVCDFTPGGMKEYFASGIAKDGNG